MSSLNCPLCGERFNKFYTVKANIGNYQLPIAECSNCAFAIQTPQPSLEESTDYMNWRYSSIDPSDKYITDLKGKQTISRQRIRWLNTFSKPNKQLLDIGAGIGIFCSIAKQLGYEATGTEICPEAVKKAKATFGIDLTYGDIYSIPCYPQFGVVTLWDVIEHLRDPLEMLKEAFARMKPNAVIVVLTGNYNSNNRFKLGQTWPIYLRDHMFYFSPKSLQIMVERAGFTEFQIHRLPAMGSTLFSRQTMFGSILKPSSTLHKLRELALVKLRKTMPSNEHSMSFFDDLLVTARKPAYVTNVEAV